MVPNSRQNGGAQSALPPDDAHRWRNKNESVFRPFGDFHVSTKILGFGCHCQNEGPFWRCLASRT